MSYSILDAMKLMEGEGKTWEEMAAMEEADGLVDYANECIAVGHEKFHTLFPTDDDKESAGKIIAGLATFSVVCEQPMAALFSHMMMSAAIQAYKITLGMAVKEGWFEDALP